MTDRRESATHRKLGHSASMPAQLRRKGGLPSATDSSRRGSRKTSGMGVKSRDPHRSPSRGGDSMGRSMKQGGHTAKPMKLTIRDIVENDTAKRPTSKNLIKGLEANVRKVLEAKRNEYDRVHFKLQQKQKELANLKLQLGDLAKDGAALGLNDGHSSGDRLKPVVAISTRPVYTKHTRLEQMVEALEDKKQQIQKVVHTGRIYDHMRHRLMSQRVHEKDRNRILKGELRVKQLKNKELIRDEQAGSDALMKAQQRLAKLEADSKRDMKLWQQEIKDRKSWQTQKKKFEAFVKKQIERQREIELEAEGDLTEQEEDALMSQNAAAMFANNHIARKLSNTLKNSTDEEKRYEDAFRKIGAQLGNLDPAFIIETCRAQDEIRADLIAKRKLEEDRVEALKKQLAAAQEELNNTMYAQERTTNRVLSDREKELNEAEKQLEAERSEFQFIQATVQPVKIGIQHLAKKVLDPKVLDRKIDLNHITDIEWVMNQIQTTLARIIEETRQDVGTMRSPMPAQAGTLDTPGNAAGRRSSLSLAGLTDAEENASWLLSKHNLRVDIKKEEDDEDEEEEEDSPREARRTRMEMDMEINKSMGVQPHRVYDRSDIKGMADMVTIDKRGKKKGKGRRHK